MSLQYYVVAIVQIAHIGHNPCFSRNVFAIHLTGDDLINSDESQSLF